MKAPIIVLIASAALFGASLLAAQTFGGNRPSSPIFAPIRLVGGDERKIALGRDLFVDRRLSMSTRLRCASCHDIGTNGASANALDRIDSGQIAPFNTPSVFNSAFNYRFGWAGRSRNIRDQILRGMRFDLNAGSEVPLQRLRADPKIVQRFRSIYGNYPTDVTVADALSAYVETLVTPDAPFDRWLEGDRHALTGQQLRGYQSFTSSGCSGCHQGQNVGANILEPVSPFRAQRGGMITSLRVPSLRNVAVTPPYFHDGRTSSLQEAVRQCARDRLDLTLRANELADLSAYLQSLTGSYRGHTLRPARGGHG